MIYVDADACPVKDEVYRVAGRYDLSVTLVAGSWMRIPNDPRIALEVVDQGMDAADDWIVEHATRGDLVITADIPLASRCLAKGVSVLGPTGRPFTEANIGDVLATRNLLAELRDTGQIRGGGRAFDQAGPLAFPRRTGRHGAGDPPPRTVTRPGTIMLVRGPN